MNLLLYFSNLCCTAILLCFKAIFIVSDTLTGGQVNRATF